MNAKLLRLSSLSIYYQFALVLSFSLLIPFVVHFIPSPTGLPIGAYLIPLFFIPSVAVFFFNKWPLSVAAAIAPYIYSLFNGLPVFEVAAVLSVELFLFTHMLYLLKDTSKLSFAAPLFSLFIVKLLVAAGISLFAVTLYQNILVDYAVLSFVNALPGIILLHIIFNYTKKLFS